MGPGWDGPGLDIETRMEEGNTWVLPDWLAGSGFVLQMGALARECNENRKVQIIGFQTAWVQGGGGSCNWKVT